MAKILLTEDDGSVRGFIARALQLDGHDVITADDGEEGFDRLVEHNGAFDLLLTDIKMPFMDGIELARTAAAKWPELKILMMTGFADQRERADGLDSIVIDVVSKPFTLAQIRESVRRAINIETADEIQTSVAAHSFPGKIVSKERENNMFSSVLKVSK